MNTDLMERQKAAAQKISARYPQTRTQEFRGDITLTVPAEQLLEVMRYAKEGAGFDMLLCVSAVDHLNDNAAQRFEVNYALTQAETGVNLLVRVELSEDSPRVGSVVGIWRSANWLEREQYDMLGIEFEGHPDLRRILMWDEYPYFPMRKDFPLEGVPTELPGVAFTEKAPTAGAPFCTRPGNTAGEREARAQR